MRAPVSPYKHNKRQSTTVAASEDCLFLKYMYDSPTRLRRSTTLILPVPQ
ncbi:hypothetical protein J3R82DRAFT_11134 [Butyriboletus roseoflavus]|nr:hypothetical protein J3R82DRAFT_11134 [Butyriboletus roseoflavus]